MNTTYSKEELLVEAANNILLADTTPLSSPVQEINFYCSTRIGRDDAQQIISPPCVLINTEVLQGEIALPSFEYILELTAVVGFMHQYPITTLNNIAARISTLFHMQTATLNAAVSGKNLRCRLLQQLSATRLTDSQLKVYRKTVRFRVILDDEILVGAT